MLRSLSIRDFVIVDRMELEFSPGFTVLSGETGAGKSILVDALALALGARSDAIAVRHGAERAEISADFDVSAVSECARWLEENELADEGGACLLRRVIDQAGRSRGFINGRAATLAQLRAAGEFLVDIHGQHQHQSLLRPSAQRELLDAFGDAAERGREVSAAFRLWQDRRGRLIEAETHAAAFGAEREQLEWQVREMAALNFTVGDWEALGAEHARLAHAATLIESSQRALEALSEAEESSLSGVNAAINRLRGLLQYDARLQDILDALDAVRIQLQEACYALRRYGERIEADPERQRQIERRIEAVHAVARKHRVAADELPGVLARAQARLAQLAEEADPEALRVAEQEARAAYAVAAKKLTAVRSKAARRLSEEVTGAIQGLAMGGGSFSVALRPLDAPALHGAEEVEFLVSPHKSIPPQPLAKIASGGELSRVSLAIQAAASRVAPVPTLIFDEVDAGIGGRVAEIVGRMLKELGRRHQVMCITHLPQVAASADHQWQVSKSTADGKVSSSVAVLDAKQRVEEIARMLGGLKITDTTRRHAAEMLGVKR